MVENMATDHGMSAVE